MFQPLHNCCDGCRDFEDVWISPVDDGHGEGVRGEEEDGFGAVLWGEVLECGFNALGYGLRESATSNE